MIDLLSLHVQNSVEQEFARATLRNKLLEQEFGPIDWQENPQPALGSRDSQIDVVLLLPGMRQRLFSIRKGNFRPPALQLHLEVVQSCFCIGQKLQSSTRDRCI